MRLKWLLFLLLITCGKLISVQSCTKPTKNLSEVLQKRDMTSTLDWIDASENHAVETLISLYLARS